MKSNETKSGFATLCLVLRQRPSLHAWSWLPTFTSNATPSSPSRAPPASVGTSAQVSSPTRTCNPPRFVFVFSSNAEDSEDRDRAKMVMVPLSACAFFRGGTDFCSPRQSSARRVG